MHCRPDCHPEALIPGLLHIIIPQVGLHPLIDVHFENFSPCLPLSQNYEAFFDAREDNAVYAFLGLTAPPGSKVSLWRKEKTHTLISVRYSNRIPRALFPVTPAYWPKYIFIQPSVMSWQKHTYYIIHLFLISLHPDRRPHSFTLAPPLCRNRNCREVCQLP